VVDENKIIRQKIHETRLKLIEYEEMISINIDIISMLKESGLISEDKPEYIEILNIHRDNQKGYKDFILNHLPEYLDYDNNKKLSEDLFSWLSQYLSKLRAEDKILKKYINSRIVSEQNKKTPGDLIDIKDKRFWKFLDNLKNKTDLFESFNLEEEEGTS